MLFIPTPRLSVKIAPGMLVKVFDNFPDAELFAAQGYRDRRDVSIARLARDAWSDEYHGYVVVEGVI